LSRTADYDLHCAPTRAPGLAQAGARVTAPAGRFIRFQAL
jgi:hypothetical protein